MTLPLPSADVTEVNSGPIVTGPADKVYVAIGPCSKGPLFTPTPISSQTTLTSTFGAGPTVKATAYSLGKVGSSVVFIRIPATTIAATVSAVDESGMTNQAVNPAVTGTPTDSYHVIVDFPTGGTTGIAGIMYRVSLDGGETYTSATALGTGLTIAPSGTGLTITLVTGQAITSDDYFSFYTLPASASILKQTTTRSNVSSPSTSVLAVTGTPIDAYELIFEVVTGGTVGTAGITYRYSLDNGNTWVGPLRLGTANTVQINDGDEDSGLDVTLAAGTLDALDRIAANTTAPGFQASDVATAIEAVDDSSHEFGFIHAVGSASGSVAGSVGGTVQNLSTLDSGNATYTMVVMSARDRGAAETPTEWATRLISDYELVTNNRLSVGAGYARITCPVTGRRNRRPVAWVLVPEMVRRPVAEDPGRKATGALSSDIRIHDDDNNLVEHDARVDSSLHGARFVTLRTYKNNKGAIYVTRGNLMNAEGDRFDRIPKRRVMNGIDDIYRQVLEEQLENDMFTNPVGATDGSVPGALREEDASRLEREVESEVRTRFGNSISGVRVTVDRNEVTATTGVIRSRVEVDALAYVDKLVGTTTYSNPALAALRA
ncbi:hypothetical protein BE21_57520 [Sorangium cellulosum]|uniref:Uncharacterized protein n=1 Tax=Sorangium cellulosum TaxID=56 RepID=A0A150U3C8_SORCE|nr:hypothetical protein BE21_57520 [Sorangium cellulosum]